MFEDDDRRYVVVHNDEGQFSIWPELHDMPPGWTSVDKAGTKAECLAYVDKVWVDMRPKGLRE